MTPIEIFFVSILDWPTCGPFVTEKGDPGEVAEEEPGLKVVVGESVRFGIDASVENEGV